MKMEDLAKRLRASGEIEKCCLAAVIEHEFKRIETESFEGIGKTVYYLNGCIEAICAFGEITEAEKRELCADIDARAYGGPVS